VHADGTGTMDVAFTPSPNDPTDADGNDIALLNSAYNFVIVGNKTQLRAMRGDASLNVTASFTAQ
jgi:hypothetical protein